MVEVEVKFAAADFESLLARLRGWGVEPGPARRDADRYFNAPDRDFGSTDEALRIRSIGDKNYVTYKGPKFDRETKSRLEIEVELADGHDGAEDFGRILMHLGYKPVAIVRKARRIAHLMRGGFEVQVSLDDVDGVGRYAEVEAVAEESQFAEAKSAVLAVAADLGLTNVERRSYLHLLLERS